MSIDTYAQLDRHFLGYARIKLENIDFHSGRDLDSHNVKRLVGIFQLQGCERESTDNAISVLVERSAVEDVLTSLGPASSANHYLIPDQLPYLNTKMICLQGKHRIYAARKFLHHPDRWWIAKLFSADLPLYAQEYVRYKTSNTLEFSKGDIFRHHLDAERRGDKSADKWLGMLALDTQYRVRQLKKDDELLNSFFKLLPFPGLWPDCDLGPLTRELPMRCREEQHCYLRSIYQRWTYILGSDVDPHCLDLQTVRLFQVLMPANSSCDARAICASMGDFRAFPHVRNPSVRNGLQARVLSCDRILTLKSFHRDTIVLEGCYQPLRHLFPVEETTLQRACEESFKHDLRYFRANYIDLWLHVMRNHPYLSDHPSSKPIKDGNEEEPVHYLKSEAEVSRLVAFAASRGFWTSRIESLLPQDHVWMHSEPVGTKVPKLSSKNSSIQHQYRSSRPRTSDFERAWKHLSLQSVFEAQRQLSLKYPTAFAVVKDIARCFWSSVTPGEIANPERILQVDQYMKQHNELSEYADESLPLLSQNGIAAKFAHVQEGSRKSADIPCTASSRYSDSRRSSSATTYPRNSPRIESQYWKENDFTEYYRGALHIPNTEDDDGFHRANASNEGLLVPPSSGTRTEPQAAIKAGSLALSPQDVARRQRVTADKGPGRVDRACETLHELRKAGHQGVSHRVEKLLQRAQNKKSKQQQAQLERALQGHADESRLQAGHSNLLDTLRTEIEDAPTAMKPLNARSCEVTEWSELLHPQDERTLLYRSSDREALVASNATSALLQLVHDDSGIEAQFSAPTQDLQCIAKRWNYNDEDDDVQTATRKAEEQISSADDAVGDVHDGSSAGHDQQSNKEGVDGVIDGGDMVKITTDTMSDVFPGGPIEAPVGSSVDLHEPSPPAGGSRLGNVPVDTSKEDAFSPDEKRAMYHATSSAEKTDNSVLPRIQAIQSYEEGAHGGQADRDSVKQSGQHLSMFPGGSLVPYDMKQVTTDRHSSSQVSTQSKKRNFPNEFEYADVHSRVPRPPSQVQLSSWEPFEEIVDSIRRIYSDLDHNRIYITSPIEIEELSAQQLLNQRRLWSWPEEGKVLFDRLISSLLAKKFGFQVVSSDAHSQRRHYCSLDHMEYWNAYFGGNKPGYWLAVLTPWRVAGSSREKVRKILNDGNSRAP